MYSRARHDVNAYNQGTLTQGESPITHEDTQITNFRSPTPTVTPGYMSNMTDTTFSQLEPASKKTKWTRTSPSSPPHGWEQRFDSSGTLYYYNPTTHNIEHNLDDLSKKPRATDKCSVATFESSSGKSLKIKKSRRVSPPKLSTSTTVSPAQGHPPDSPSSSDEAAQPDAIASSTVPAQRHSIRKNWPQYIDVLYDLVSSEDGNAEDKGQQYYDDESTDLDEPRSEELPTTEQFDWQQHHDSDGGHPDNDSEHDSEVNQSEVLLD